MYVVPCYSEGLENSYQFPTLSNYFPSSQNSTFNFVHYSLSVGLQCDYAYFGHALLVDEDADVKIFFFFFFGGGGGAGKKHTKNFFMLILY